MRFDHLIIPGNTVYELQFQRVCYSVESEQVVIRVKHPDVIRPKALLSTLSRGVARETFSTNE